MPNYVSAKESNYSTRNLEQSASSALWWENVFPPKFFSPISCTCTIFSALPQCACLCLHAWASVTPLPHVNTYWVLYPCFFPVCMLWKLLHACCFLAGFTLGTSCLRVFSPYGDHASILYMPRKRSLYNLHTSCLICILICILPLKMYLRTETGQVFRTIYYLKESCLLWVTFSCREPFHHFSSAIQYGFPRIRTLRTRC